MIVLILTLTLASLQASAGSAASSSQPGFPVWSVGLTTYSQPMPVGAALTQQALPHSRNSLLPHDPLSLTRLLSGPGALNHSMFSTSEPLFIGLNSLNHGVALDNVRDRVEPSSGDERSRSERPEQSTENWQLSSPAPAIKEPWAFEGNGAQGVKTWLSERHVLEINPAWLSFEMFDSMDLNMIDQELGPGIREPQEWRSAFTVGVASDWHLTRNLAMHAGYRFYANPIPDDITSGAYLNANQHVMAVGMSLREGPHSLSMIYGLDMYDPASDAGISSARYGSNLARLGHLVALRYGFSF